MPFLKNLFENIEHIKENKLRESGFKNFDIYFQDESRFGLLTIQRRMLTIKGIKPIVPYQHRFQNFYLFGAYSPLSGTHFTLELSYCNADCFQLYIDEFSKQDQATLKIIILDNGAFHKAKWLNIPDNIALLFLPPYSPELNPAEKMWNHFKSQIANIAFETLDKLSDKLVNIIQKLNNDTIKSITNYKIYQNILMPFYDR